MLICPAQGIRGRWGWCCIPLRKLCQCTWSKEDKQEGSSIPARWSLTQPPRQPPGRRNIAVAESQVRSLAQIASGLRVAKTWTSSAIREELLPSNTAEPNTHWFTCIVSSCITYEHSHLEVYVINFEGPHRQTTWRSKYSHESVTGLGHRLVEKTMILYNFERYCVTIIIKVCNPPQ